MSAFTAPDTRNYQIGKGNLFFTPEGGSERHIGNVPECEIELEPETLEHFSSMEGVRSKDVEVVVQQEGTVTVLMEEITPENLAIAMLGTATQVNGNTEIDIMSRSQIVGRLRFEGTGDVGPKYNFDLPRVSFRPNGAVPWISDEWNQLPIQGEILRDPTEGFGKITLLAATEATEPTE